MKRNKKRWKALIVVPALILSQFSMMGMASAGVNTISVSLAASEPTTYNHATGGGGWNQGKTNIDIVKSLESANFKCNDIVSYLTKVDVPSTSDLIARGDMTIDFNYAIGMYTTGQQGVALGDPTVSIVNQPDSATVSNGASNSTATIVGSTASGPMYTKPSDLMKTVRVTGIEAGETIIIRVDTTLHCLSGSSPAGNVHFDFNSAVLVADKNGPVSPNIALNSGTQTITLQNVQSLGHPSVVIVKTVTTPTGDCATAGKSVIIEPKDQVKFCYAVTNNSNSGGQLGAPLYNVSQIADDNGGKLTPFNVTLTSGLTDIDKDGQVDDLAVGATAYGSYITAFDGDKDSVVTNTALVSGYDQPTGGTMYSDTDTATVNVDAPAPAITISKLTNGGDSLTILVGTPITWTYLVTNTGDRDLHDVYVTDSESLTVVCPGSTLTKNGGSMTCSATGTAIVGNYANVGTVYGTYNSTQVTASDSSSYFGANPLIDIQKTPDTQTVVESMTATFTITVSNIGNVPLTGVVVSDPKATNCNKTIGSLAVSGQNSYTCVSGAITQDMTNTASVEGYFNSTKVTDSDDANVIVDFLPNIEVKKTVDKPSIPETGDNVTFTFSVKNKAPEDFILTSLVDDNFGDLNKQGTCVTPETITAGSTYSCTLTVFLASDSLTAHINVLTASGHDPQGNPGSGSDTATVTFTDVLPSLTVTKIANPTLVPESGGSVLFTYSVKNNSKEALYLDSLIDDKFGTLNGQGTPPTGCVLPQIMAGLGTYTCSVTKTVGNWTLTPHVNTVVATGHDNEMNYASDTTTATVNFTDLKPTISVLKTVNPTVVRSTGDYVDYTIKITNTGPESVTVTSIVDTVVALSKECNDLVGQMIAPAGNLQCTIHIFMTVAAGSSLTNTVSVIAEDNEGNKAPGSSSAVLKSYWYGRTPGYWKNHASAWISGYTPGQFVQSVFESATVLISSGSKLDLDGDSAKDTLIAGLAYKGGSNLAGAAQILLRASIAALLNKAYYGADYPAELSTSALIAHVNSILATQNRDQYLYWAGYYDKWNNGVEGPLP